MAFNKTRDSLENFSRQENMTIEGALSVILDFCEDFEEGIRHLPVEDPKRYLQYMRKCNRFMLDIMKKHEPSQIREDNAGKLQKQKEALEELSRQLEEEENSISAEMNDFEDQRQNLLQRQRTLQARKDDINQELIQLEERKKALDREYEDQNLARIHLQNEIAALDERISGGRRTLEESKSQKRELEEAQRQLNIRMERVAAEENILRRKIEDELKPALDSIWNLQRARQEEAESLSREHDSRSARLRELMEMNEKLCADLETKNAVIRAKENEQSELLRSIAEGKDHVTSITLEVQRLREAVQSEDKEGLLHELEEKKRELSAQRDCHERLRDECEALTEEIEQLRGELPGLEAELTRRRAEEELLSAQRKEVGEQLEQFNRRLYDFESMQERLAKLKKISSVLEQDIRILQKKSEWEPYSPEEGMEDTLAYCEAAVKKIRKSMQAYIKQAAELQ